MRATKVTMVVTVEVLSFSAIPNMLRTAAAQIEREVVEGEHVMEDGDQVTWTISEEAVEF